MLELFSFLVLLVVFGFGLWAVLDDTVALVYMAAVLAGPVAYLARIANGS